MKGNKEKKTMAPTTNEISEKKNKNISHQEYLIELYGVAKHKHTPLRGNSPKYFNGMFICQACKNVHFFTEITPSITVAA